MAGPPLGNMAVVNETFESDDQEESLEDVSNDTSGTNIPLKQLSLVSKLDFPADASNMNMPLDVMLPRGFDLEDVPATDIAKKLEYGMAAEGCVVEDVQYHLLSKDEQDVFEVPGASNFISFHQHTKHGKVSQVYKYSCSE